MKRNSKSLKENKKRPARAVNESKYLVEKPIYNLRPEHDSRQSFYGKAIVDTGDKGDKNKLYSYGTLVAEIKDGKPVVYGTYSATTLRHIKEWLQQLGFKAVSKAQIEKDYMQESCNTKALKEGSSDTFQHLSDEEVDKLFKKFKAQGMSDDEAFGEIYSIDCNMDEEDGDIDESCKKQLKEEVQDEAYEIADSILQTLGSLSASGEDTMDKDKFEEEFFGAIKEIDDKSVCEFEKDKVTINGKEFSINDLETDIRGILSYNGWATDFNTGDLTTKEIEEDEEDPDVKWASVKPYLDIVLEDDNTSEGGTSFAGETFKDFLMDSNLTDQEIIDMTNDEWNKLLKDNGIKPIFPTNESCKGAKCKESNKLKEDKGSFKSQLAQGRIDLTDPNPENEKPKNLTIDLCDILDEYTLDSISEQLNDYLYDEYNSVPVNYGYDGIIISMEDIEWEDNFDESCKKSSKKKPIKEAGYLKDYKDAYEIINDCIDWAQSDIDNGDDVDDAIYSAIDEACIYNSDIMMLAEHYGVIDTNELIEKFYDELYNDIYNGVEEKEEDEETEESLKESKKKINKKQIKESMKKKKNLKEAVDNSTQAKLAKFLKGCLDESFRFSDSYKSFDLDGDFSVSVGWLPGYDPEDANNGDIVDENGYGLCYEITESPRGYGYTDFESLMMPYNEETGDVYSVGSCFNKEDKCDRLAKYLLDEYEEIKKEFDNGELTI